MGVCDEIILCKPEFLTWPPRPLPRLRSPLLLKTLQFRSRLLDGMRRVSLPCAAQPLELFLLDSLQTSGIESSKRDGLIFVRFYLVKVDLCRFSYTFNCPFDVAFQGVVIGTVSSFQAVHWSRWIAPGRVSSERS